MKRRHYRPGELTARRNEYQSGMRRWRMGMAFSEMYTSSMRAGWLRMQRIEDEVNRPGINIAALIHSPK